MVTIDEFRKLALSFPDAEELPHFDIPSFRYKKKVFATYREKDNRAMLKLSEIDQSVFCSYNNEVFFPVNGTWGKQGYTFVDLKKVRKDMFKDALTLAYKGVAEKKKKKK
jgi:predicted DNA-binding protein (MmcQ/YjbR family)